MKLRFVFLFAGAAVLGVFAAVALAKPPPGHGPGNGHGQGAGKSGSHGNPHDATTAGTTATTTGTTTTALPRKVVLCHRTGSRKHPWVLISISRNAVRAHWRHGDKLPAVDGTCVTPTTTTTATTSTSTTTTTTTTPA